MFLLSIKKTFFLRCLKTCKCAWRHCIFLENRIELIVLLYWFVINKNGFIELYFILLNSVIFEKHLLNSFCERIVQFFSGLSQKRKLFEIRIQRPRKPITGYKNNLYKEILISRLIRYFRGFPENNYPDQMETSKSYNYMEEILWKNNINSFFENLRYIRVFC